jgi:replicative DNA helicase
MPGNVPVKEANMLFRRTFLKVLGSAALMGVTSPVMPLSYADVINDEPPESVPSGIKGLDSVINGFPAGSLTIIGGRPSMGKTALALNMAGNVGAGLERPVAVFSLETSRRELLRRMLCLEARVDSYMVKMGLASSKDRQKLALAAGNMAEVPVFINASAALTAQKIASQARALKREQGVCLIIVDYLQLLVEGRDLKTWGKELSLVTASLKRLAEELNLPVILLSQLISEVERRDPPIPRLRDILPAVADHADNVLLLYRKAMYETALSSYTEEGLDVIIAKSRTWPPATVKLRFQNEYGLVS